MTASLNLHDIVEAEPVSWWPPAWGWWVLLCGLIITLAVLAYAAVRWRQRRRAQVLALRNLRQTPASMAQITLLTKQAALAYFPRRDIAALSGERWFSFLIQTMPPAQQAEFAAQLSPWADALYSSASQPLDNYQRLMQRWVKQALPPRSKEMSSV